MPVLFASLGQTPCTQSPSDEVPLRLFSRAVPLPHIGHWSPPFAGANGQPAFNLLAHTSYGAEIFIGARCDVGSG